MTSPAGLPQPQQPSISQQRLELLTKGGKELTELIPHWIVHIRNDHQASSKAGCLWQGMPNTEFEISRAGIKLLTTLYLCDAIYFVIIINIFHSHCAQITQLLFMVSEHLETIHGYRQQEGDSEKMLFCKLGKIEGAKFLISSKIIYVEVRTTIWYR